MPTIRHRQEPQLPALELVQSRFGSPSDGYSRDATGRLVEGRTADRLRANLDTVIHASRHVRRRLSFHHAGPQRHANSTATQFSASHFKPQKRRRRKRHAGRCARGGAGGKENCPEEIYRVAAERTSTTGSKLK